MKKTLFILVIAILACVSEANAQNTANVQMQLVNSSLFVGRIEYLLTQFAVTTMAEPVATVCHVSRIAYAQTVINNPANLASSAVVVIVSGVNLTSVAVTGAGLTADSAATDAAIASQISTYWNALSKCPTGS
jgi:hypothetical protein